jgi:hypothetical protein
MTREDFVAEVEEFISYYCQDYVKGAAWKMTLEDDDDFEAEVEIELFSDGESKWTVPIGVDRNGKKHRAAIATNPDTSSYLDLNDAGLYTYLFFEAEKLLMQERGRAHDQRS